MIPVNAIEICIRRHKNFAPVTFHDQGEEWLTNIHMESGHYYCLTASKIDVLCIYKATLP